MHRRVGIVLCAALLAVAGCRRPAPPADEPPAESRVPATAPFRDYDGLHNVLPVTDKLLSGSSPEGDAGFRSLQQLGVKTVISVDGATPDLERAKRLGLRYVHLPLGYDGIPAETGARIARAVRDLPGKVYLHCHHGKHRGPAAAAYARRCLDDTCPAADALAFMKDAGTDPRYKGLFASVEGAKLLGSAELNAVPADFPETAEVPKMAALMVEIDGRADKLKAARTNRWRAAGGDPANDAVQLIEHYKEAARLPDAAKKPAGFRELLAAAEAEARRLEKAIRAGDTSAADAAFAKSTTACFQCHKQYRD
jgi:protein tyrosine phosphatase (PTP) superfamily phosphohydrolase (DUF442 family)